MEVIRLEGLTKVMQRIHSIQQRFGITGNQTLLETHPSFSATLEKVAESPDMKSESPSTLTSSSTDIEKMLYITAKKYNVDPKLATAIAKTESNFDPTAVSSVGAAGIMQLMPDTARSLGVKNIFDPRENIDGGVRYLKSLIDQFSGDLSMAVAAYNAGPGAVKQYNGVPPYPETTEYVSKVLTMIKS